MTPETVMNELAGLQALARSLAHGDADADDLIQDTAIAAIAHTADDRRPFKPWLVTVLLNRWRMDRRARSRRIAREEAVELAPIAALDPSDAIDRARMLERLATALVALDEPYRRVVIGRYLDGKSAAELAREHGIPAATVRWRLKTGLDRLRAALDESAPKWRAVIPFPAIQGIVLVKAKTATLSICVLLLLIGMGVFGYSRFAPELSHSPVRIALAAKQVVRGITLFLFPAIDYDGVVVDAQNAPVPGAKVKLADPAGEQTLIKLATEWTTDARGHFTFNAPDDAVLEAVKGGKRGWSILDGKVATTHKLTIKLGDAAARDVTIKGKTVDTTGQPLPGVLVTAIPDLAKDDVPHPSAFATSDGDGSFAFADLDRIPYTLIADLDDHARARRDQVPGGTQNVVIAIDRGLPLGGFVRDPDDQPIPSFTLLVTKREGMIRDVVSTRTVIDPTGKFSVYVPKGDYELLISASGWAPSAPVAAAAGTTDTKIQLSRGATLAGRVFDAKSREPLPYTRVQREGGGGGASALPVNAGTVTRADGTFELAGIPPGPFSISIVAGNHHPKLEAGLVAVDGGTLGPIEIALMPVAEGETPQLELVGIGLKLSADGDAIKVELVIPKSGAEAAGIVAGDRITAIDGIAVTTIGLDGAIARIRGVAGTTLSVTLLRDGKPMQLVVERKPLKFG